MGAESANLPAAHSCVSIVHLQAREAQRKAVADVASARDAQLWQNLIFQTQLIPPSSCAYHAVVSRYRQTMEIVWLLSQVAPRGFFAGPVFAANAAAEALTLTYSDLL